MLTVVAGALHALEGGGGGSGAGRLARRVAVVDFDVHHGNGTEEIARAWRGLHTRQPFPDQVLHR